MTWLYVGLAGAAGAVTRYGISQSVGPRMFPFATLTINITGSLLLGFVLTIGALGRLSPQATTAIAIGFLGAYTTFSTFSWELFTLGRTDRLVAGVLYLALSVVLGVLAAGVGYRLGNALP